MLPLKSEMKLQCRFALSLSLFAELYACLVSNLLLLPNICTSEPTTKKRPLLKPHGAPDAAGGVPQRRRRRRRFRWIRRRKRRGSSDRWRWRFGAAATSFKRRCGGHSGWWGFGIAARVEGRRGGDRRRGGFGIAARVQGRRGGDGRGWGILARAEHVVGVVLRVEQSAPVAALPVGQRVVHVRQLVAERAGDFVPALNEKKKRRRKKKAR